MKQEWQVSLENSGKVCCSCQKMRAAGINVPVMIDAANWEKRRISVNQRQIFTSADPQHNYFSHAHMGFSMPKLVFNRR
jgi:hypothetical protein